MANKFEIQREIRKESGVPEQGAEEIGRPAITHKASELYDVVSEENEDSFLKDKEDRYMVNTSKSGNLYKGEYKEAGNVVDPESDTDLLDKELFGEEADEDIEEFVALRKQQAQDMIKYNKEHAGENGTSGVKRPDLSKANFTEKAMPNYKEWENRAGKKQSRITSVDTEDISDKDKIAA